jgi:hypothetical protein
MINRKWSWVTNFLYVNPLQFKLINQLDATISQVYYLTFAGPSGRAV